MSTVAASGETASSGWIPDETSFGARLALVRQRMRWNGREAALACGLPAPSWRGWETRGAACRDQVGVARRIADRTGCDFLWLLAGVRREPMSGWVPEDDTFGARLALVRQRMRWNAKKAAQACGLPAQSWRDWEHGMQCRNQESTARAIAGRTGCDYLWLLTGVTPGQRTAIDEMTYRRK